MLGADGGNRGLQVIPTPERFEVEQRRITARPREYLALEEDREALVEPEILLQLAATHTHTSARCIHFNV